MACKLCENIWDVDNLELDYYLEDKDYANALVREPGGAIGLRVHDIKEMEVDYIIKYFQYCPICGRKLTEDEV